MKKSLTIIALAALVMLAGCKKNDPKPNGTRLIAGIEKHKSDSKTSLDGLQIKWTAGDKLYVYDKDAEEGAIFTLSSGEGTSTGEFTGTYNFTNENVAVYPSSSFSGSGGTIVTMTLPAVQTASGSGSFGNGANPMLGVFSDLNNLTLTSLCGVLCLELTGNAAISAIEIVGGPDDKLNGTFTVDYMNPVLTYSANGTNTVRLNCNATLTPTAQKFYVVVPAGTLHGFTMKVYDGDNEIFSKSTANEVPVYVNTLSTMVPVEVVPFNPLATPLTFEAREANVSVEFGGLFTAPALEYSKNGCEWNSFPGQITLENVGDIVSFRGNNSSTNQNQFSCSGQCYIYGNVMSLLHADDYATNYTLTSNAFYRLFMGNTNIDIHPDKDLVLPATTLANYCYRDMFRGCESLTKAPILPATELASNCYHYMFSGCMNLQTAPGLPATTLNYYCYAYMFQNCTSLQTAPELPATELASNCYYSMFQNCTSLQTAPELPATTLAEYCYFRMFDGCQYINSITCLATSFAFNSTYNWVNGVAATGTFTKASGVTWPTGPSGIPSGWITYKFSVSATQAVQFAPGNLQYKSGEGWRFAEHQYDYIGAWDATNWVDYFGWGTWGEGKNPLLTSTDNADYQWSTDFQGTLNGHNDWYTLSIDEWIYLFQTRTNASSLYGMGTVNGVNGIILLPDGSTLSINTDHNSWSNNTIDATTWANTYEVDGAVFLPGAGRRSGTGVGYIGAGVCWSSTPHSTDSEKAYDILYNNGALSVGDVSRRFYGYSVRLARIVQQ